MSDDRLTAEEERDLVAELFNDAEERCKASEAELAAVTARAERAERDWLSLYDAVDQAQKIDATGGGSAVSVVLWVRAEHRARLAEGST